MGVNIISIKCFNQTECSFTKTCFNLPKNCNLQDDKGCKIISWVANEENLLFSIAMKLNETKPYYVSMAIANNYDMTDGDAYNCQFENNQVNLTRSLIDHRGRPTTVDMGFITEIIAEKVEDDIIECVFTRSRVLMNTDINDGCSEEKINFMTPPPNAPDAANLSALANFPLIFMTTAWLIFGHKC